MEVSGGLTVYEEILAFGEVSSTAGTSALVIRAGTHGSGYLATEAEKRGVAQKTRSVPSEPVGAAGCITGSGSLVPMGKRNIVLRKPT